MNIREHIGMRVRYLRTKQGLTQKDLAKAAGVHRSYLAAIENGTVNISLSTVERLTNGFGITASEFFRGHMMQNLRP